MRHIHEFSKNAHSYNEHSSIQRQVAKEVLQMLPFKPNSIVDIGCGTGSLYKMIDWPLKHYYALDFSKQMLAHHPQAPEVETVHANFDEKDYLGSINMIDVDMILSSSSLQWSKDFGQSFATIYATNKPFVLTLFTANTFKKVHDFTQTASPIHSLQTIQEALKSYDGIDIEVRHYTKSFETRRDVFTYMKQSGVSGGSNQLSYKATKKLLNEFPWDYLDFEVIFISSFSRS